MLKIKRSEMVRMTFLFSCLMLTSFAIAQEEKQAAQNEPASIPLSVMAKSYVDYYSSEQFTFAIDLDSILIPSGEENEIRYTSRASGKEGVINISYEGIRCGNRQKIIYAIGREDGSWTRTRALKWSAIPKTGINLQQAGLANDYFCEGNTLSGSVESIRDRIKWKRALGLN